MLRETPDEPQPLIHTGRVRVLVDPEARTAEIATRTAQLIVIRVPPVGDVAAVHPFAVRTGTPRGEEHLADNVGMGE